MQRRQWRRLGSRVSRTERMNPHSGHRGTSGNTPIRAATVAAMRMTCWLNMLVRKDYMSAVRSVGRRVRVELRQPPVQQLDGVAPPVGDVGRQAEVVGAAGEDAAAAVCVQEQQLDQDLLAGVLGRQ